MWEDDDDEGVLQQFTSFGFFEIVQSSAAIAILSCLI